MQIRRLLTFVIVTIMMICCVTSVAFAEEEISAESNGSSMVAVYPLALDVSISRDAFLSADKLSGGCTAADCAAFLRNEAPAALVDTVKSTLLTPTQENLERAMIRLAAGYPVYGGLSFTECPEVPMITDGLEMELDTNYNLHGIVTSDAPITNVTATITHSERNGSLYPCVKSVEFSPEENITCYDINEEPIGEKVGLNGMLDLGGLRHGEQTLVITATTTEQTEPVELVRATYNVVAKGWFQLRPDNFSDNYKQTLEFFSNDPTRFMFEYRWRDGRKIAMKHVFRSVYLVDDEWGSVHQDAVPYFEKAREYIASAQFRVQSADGTRDTGVIPLNDMVITNNGTCIARFTQSKKYISHHSFGTVVDLNADIQPNKQRAYNKERIYDAVHNHLTYNGIMTAEDGTQYYDYTYSGVYKNAVKEVPPEIMNYLLYELAFYRAGFRWGFYFDTSDAMHFSLTESTMEAFTDGPYALRKVFTYADE